jgi:hypothetical protein
MAASSQSTADLLTLFGAVAKQLAANQTALNKADTINHDHGTNMVNTFDLITKAIAQKKNSTPSQQLTYASQVLSQKSSSGSAQLYAKGLAKAAQRIQGQKTLDGQTVMAMAQAMMESEQATASRQAAPQPSGGTDLLGGILGELMGGQTQQTTQSQGSSGDLLGGLLGSLTGGTTQNTQQGGGQIDLGDLLSAGAAYVNAKQSGKSTMEAAIDAMMAGSSMTTSPARETSGRLVTETLLQAVTQLSQAAATSKRR